MSEIIWKKLISPWIPEQADEEIAGRILGIETEVGENKSMFYILETQENVRGVWGSTVLDEKMKHFKVGDIVRIVFLGRKKGSRKDDYKDYDVYKGIIAEGSNPEPGEQKIIIN